MRRAEDVIGGLFVALLVILMLHGAITDKRSCLRTQECVTK